MMKLLKIFLLVILCLVCASVAFAKDNTAVNMNYRILRGLEIHEEEDEDKIAVGMVYLGSVKTPQDFNLPGKLGQIKSIKVYGGGQEVYLLIPKFKGTEIVVSRTHEKYPNSIKDKTILSRTFDTPIVVFCNQEETPYETYVEIKGTQKVKRFLLHCNQVTGLPEVPTEIRDYTTDIMW